MSSYVVWIDTEHAKVFKMSAEGNTHHDVKNHEHSHHGFNPRDQHPDHQKFYHSVAEKLKGAGEILIVGPGLGKDHFKNHLEKHHASDLAKKVLSVESMDHPSDPQILAHARKFFKHAHLFN
jgi:hypothetical protein